MKSPAPCLVRHSGVAKPQRPPLPGLLLVGLLAVPGVLVAATPSIQIDGLNATQLQNARAFLGLSGLKCDTAQWRLQSALDKAPQEITQGLQALGHYRPKISGGQLKREAGCWSVNYRVDPGTPVKLAEVDVQIQGEASDDRRFARLLRDLPLKPGQVLNHGAYEDLKTQLLSLASQRGYFEARFSDHRLLIKPSSGQAWVHLRLQSGSRYRFGQISYQQEGLNEALLRRYEDFEPDEPFSTNKLNRFQQALMASNYFDNVMVKPQQDRASKRVNLEVELTGRKQLAYGIGLGFSTDEGPRASFDFEKRYVNKRGHRFRTSGKLSAIGGNLISSYAIPLDDPTQEWLTFSGQFEQEETDSSDRYTFSLGAKMTSDLGNNWLQTLALDLMHEEYEVGSLKDHATPLVPSISWEQTRRKGRNLIREGHQFKLKLAAAPVDFSNGSRFVQAEGSAFWIGTPWENGRILARGQLGATWAEDAERLSVSHRFFAGGDRSIRGYDFESLGPKNPSGEVIGGTYLAVASLEYEHRVLSDWAVAAFVDSGNAYDDDLNDIYTGVGLGLRWFSPIGPIKLDLAHPLDDPDNDFRVHLSIGPEF
ncbi:outer membrane protein assembly factor [Magnetovirga frankeli]|uniref:autotransporter assembly complex protein TamA n=1 Tax=Magnetovirga frankeli TaxID=947516 RepID=UPI001293341C|nr:outer membrane protein assembly factor [gamma proteobacterium SS-5]